MSAIAARNNWTIGLKNGKWFSEHFNFADEKINDKLSSMEKTWIGISKYIKNNEFIFIMRGVDIENKGNFRNVPIHEAAKRVKKMTGIKLFFDPSHSFGPKLRDNIVEGTIKAMSLRLDENNYLYDGILIEVGTSETDKDQHITITELETLTQKLSSFRDLKAPSYS
jgi:3-deoxy-D-arabino-heptulosonate 7-phosphate (DAHP) synthase